MPATISRWTAHGETLFGSHLKAAGFRRIDGSIEWLVRKRSEADLGTEHANLRPQSPILVFQFRSGRAITNMFLLDRDRFVLVYKLLS